MRSGLLAEFESPDALLRAFDALRRDGYTRLRAWTPFPIKGIVKQLPESLIPYIMLGAGLFGGAFGYIVQWWCNARAFAINVGGRPLDSAPSNIPITFETTVLFAALPGFFALLGFSGLPRLHHPVFEIEGFDRASVDRYWLGIDEADPRFDVGVRDSLLAFGALRCERLEAEP